MSKKTLKEISKKLDRIIGLLEGQKPPTITVPAVWYNPDIPDIPDFPFPIKFHDNKKCEKCGINLEGVMGYACHVQDCPTGLGGVKC